MADNPTGLSTEQLLIELGKVVLGLGRKIETLGEKMDAIHSVLAEDIAPALKTDAEAKAGETATIDFAPVLGKLDELKDIFEKQTAASDNSDPQAPGELSEKLTAIETVLSGEILPAIKESASVSNDLQIDMGPVLEKLDAILSSMGESEAPSELPEKLAAIESVLSGEILPAIKESATGSNDLQIDLGPVLEKLDAISSSMGDNEAITELKPLFVSLSTSFEEFPSVMTARLKELKESDSSNPMEAVELKLGEVCSKLEDIHKISEDREYVEKMSLSIAEVKEQMILSGDQLLGVVKEVPVKIDKMGEHLSEAMSKLTETTGSMLDETQKNNIQSSESLGEIKNELEKGLKLNTDMTSQMVDLTSRFTDRAEDDRIIDMNARAISHFNRGEFKEAEALLGQALNSAPDNSELLCNTAHLKAAMNEMDEAEKLFRKALEVSPELEPAISGLGMLMVSTGRAEETIEFLKNSLEDGDPSVRTAIAYSRALTALDKHDKAVEMLESAFRSSPENPDLSEELAKYGHEEKS